MLATYIDEYYEDPNVKLKYYNYLMDNREGRENEFYLALAEKRIRQLIRQREAKNLAIDASFGLSQLNTRAESGPSNFLMPSVTAKVVPYYGCSRNF